MVGRDFNLHTGDKQIALFETRRILLHVGAPREVQAQSIT